MQPAITIQSLGNAHSPQIIELILPIQQGEFRVPTTLEKQPDLRDIDGAYHATGGGFWGAFAEEQPVGVDVHLTANHIRLVGTIGLIAIAGHTRNEKDPQSPFGVIRKMFVHKDYRGKPHNIAQLLLDTLIAHARTSGICNLYLGTIHTMEAAARFYTRNGFIPIDKTALPASFPLMAVDDTFYRRPV